MGVAFPQVLRAVGGGESYGRWDGRGWSSCRDYERVDYIGGGGEGSAMTTRLIISSFILLFNLCERNSFPETCAQRISEGGGSFML